MEALIGHQANGKAVPSEVIEHIVGKADGVPLYVEEYKIDNYILYPIFYSITLQSENSKRIFVGL